MAGKTRRAKSAPTLSSVGGTVEKARTQRKAQTRRARVRLVQRSVYLSSSTVMRLGIQASYEGRSQSEVAEDARRAYFAAHPVPVSALG